MNSPIKAHRHKSELPIATISSLDPMVALDKYSHSFVAFSLSHISRRTFEMLINQLVKVMQASDACLDLWAAEEQ